MVSGRGEQGWGMTSRPLIPYGRFCTELACSIQWRARLSKSICWHSWHSSDALEHFKVICVHNMSGWYNQAHITSGGFVDEVKIWTMAFPFIVSQLCFCLNLVCPPRSSVQLFPQYFTFTTILRGWVRLRLWVLKCCLSACVPKWKATIWCR